MVHDAGDFETIVEAGVHCHRSRFLLIAIPVAQCPPRSCINAVADGHACAEAKGRLRSMVPVPLPPLPDGFAAAFKLGGASPSKTTADAPTDVQSFALGAVSSILTGSFMNNHLLLLCRSFAV